MRKASFSAYALFWRLFAFAKPFWPGFVCAALGMAVTAATQTAFPALLRPLIDSGFSGATTFQVWWVPTAVVIIFLARGFSSFVSSYAMEWIANNVLRDIRQAMFSKLLTMPAVTFDMRSSGQLISRIIAEVSGVTNAATNVVTTLVRDSLTLVGLFGWLFWLNWRLSLIVLIVLPLLALMIFAFSKRMRQVSRQALSATAEMTRSVEEAIFGHRVIKVFQGNEIESQRFRKANANYRAQSMRLAIAQSLQSPVSQMIAAAGVTVVLTVALIQSRSGAATVGDFVSYVTAMLMMFAPMRHLADVNSQLQRGLASAEAVFALIDEKSEADTGTKIIVRARGNLVFDKVSLAYSSGGRAALRNFSLHVSAGETIAFVGPSGGGKTSLVNLIPRLYEPTQGQILLDGIPINQLTLHSLRSQIALVSQDTILFNDSLKNNILYGSQNVSDSDFEQAVTAAGLRSFLSSLPEAEGTMIGDRGVRLSGGQRQRVAIARAILKNAPILILDEATASLDSTTESQVKDAIDRIKTGRTTLIVAHRLSTIINADRIVVIDQGSISEIGTHEQLMNAGGLYSGLYKGSQVVPRIHPSEDRIG